MQRFIYKINIEGQTQNITQLHIHRNFALTYLSKIISVFMGLISFVRSGVANFLVTCNILWFNAAVGWGSGRIEVAYSSAQSGCTQKFYSWCMLSIKNSGGPWVSKKCLASMQSGKNQIERNFSCVA